ncbi:glycerol-3-phosphate acyltransferase [Candidatus Endolissoclinum faulkneri L5]|uniref:Glycerol-3-phosphate acyltransferase n=1 Tax=Candidatus Endolissoclinum faulkneri L5 TaxID=1401328 RepID=V9TTP5_9PROT|nr:glycerol-3-phosphate 1-O-acyltransferase PlsY [Candidatus Endolissoclinum faulkneri]AHC73976.1 glycerol-3-phosphate acyltransferase [Candidatus Endolissoclinum faulkneri L5]
MHAYECCVVVVATYLIGSIPFGLIITKCFGLNDIRLIGSHNIGATNVLRTGHKSLALATVLFDSCKGIIAALGGCQFGNDTASLAAVWVVIGHCFPLWIKFKGGKGVATAIGVWLALATDIGIIVCLLWLIVASVFRYASAASLAAIAVAPLLAWNMGNIEFVQAGIVIVSIIWLRHYHNIRRIIAGCESKIVLHEKKQ